MKFLYRGALSTLALASLYFGSAYLFWPMAKTAMEHFGETSTASGGILFLYGIVFVALVLRILMFLAKAPIPRYKSIGTTGQDPKANPVGRLTWAVLVVIPLIVFCVFAASAIIYGAYNQISDEIPRIRKEGVHTTGLLKMTYVTNHSVYVIPTGQSFALDVEYAVGGQKFSPHFNNIDREIFVKHTLPDGKFVPHAIEVVYVPANPHISALAEQFSKTTFAGDVSKQFDRIILSALGAGLIAWRLWKLL